MEKREIKLSIIILSWNTEALLRQCLESVMSKVKNPAFAKATAGKQKPNVEIIVVDNASSDGSVEMVKAEFPEVKLIQNKENVGFSKGNNIGIKAAKGEYIMLLNSDTLVKEGAIEKLIDFLDKHPDIDIVGPKLLNQDGSSQNNCGRFPNLDVVLVMLFREHLGGSNFVRFSPSSSREVDWLMGAAFITRAKVFEVIGGLDENLFMYMEEVEWFYRASRANFKAYFLKEAEITHLGRGSSVSGKKEPILNIYKGLILYYRKHKSKLELITLKFLLKLKALIAILIGNIKNNNYLKETYGQAIKIN